MFLLLPMEPVGINSDITIVESNHSAKRIITVTIPLEKFDSGQPIRDQSVVKLLKGDRQSALEFTTSELSEENWKTLSPGSLRMISGAIKIGGESFPLDFNVSVSEAGPGQAIEGLASTTFTTFKIDPPNVAGGLVSKVRDELHLHFRIFAKDVQRR